MDTEIKQKDNKREFLENKQGLPDSKVTEGMNNLAMKNLSSKKNDDRIMDRINILLSNPENKKKKKQWN